MTFLLSRNDLYELSPIPEESSSRSQKGFTSLQAARGLVLCPASWSRVFIYSYTGVYLHLDRRRSEFPPDLPMTKIIDRGEKTCRAFNTLFHDEHKQDT